MKPISQHKLPYMLLSVFLAFIFWLYIIDSVDPEQSSTFEDIPVVLLSENILENQNLTITSLSDSTVDLDIRAPRSTIYALRNEGLSVTLDLSKISTTGEYQMAYTLVIPNTVNTNNLMVEARTPSQITVDVGRLYSEAFPIGLIIQGSIAEGYQAGQHTISPETVTISGTVDAVSKVDRVVVVLEQENMSSRFSGELPLVMLDVQGNPIEDTSIELSELSGFVTLPIVVEREIPLVVNFTPGGGATEDDIDRLTFSTQSITVSGAEEDMAGLEEISLGSIDLSLVTDTSKSFTFPVSLDSSLINVSGISEVSVSVVISGLDTQTFNVTNISLINKPDNTSASNSTQMRTVTVRGSQEDLAQIDESQLRIVADLTDMSAIGSTSVPVKVYLDYEGDVGVIGEYTIVVNISKA